MNECIDIKIEQMAAVSSKKYGCVYCNAATVAATMTSANSVSIWQFVMTVRRAYKRKITLN